MTSIQILGNNTLVSQYQVYFRTRKAVAIDTVPKATQEEAVTRGPAPPVANPWGGYDSCVS